MEEKFDIKLIGLLLLIVLLGLTCGILAVNLKTTRAEIRTIQAEFNKQLEGQQTQIKGLSDDINSVSQDLEKVSQEFSQELVKVQQIQSNTNSALTRLRKQKEELEKKLEEGLELRKQRLAELRASQSSSSSFWDSAFAFTGGMFELTAYEWTGEPCANGEYPVPGYTVASNWFPLGTRIYIEGIGERVVTDTGGMSNNVIDIYMGDPETCIQFGRQMGNVYVIED